MLSRLLILLVLGVASWGVFSASSSGEISLRGKPIQLISGDGTPRVFVYGLEVDEGCTQKIPVLLMGGVDANPLAKEFYATLLSAKTSGKKVIIGTSGCWSEWSTPVIRSLYLLD